MEFNVDNFVEEMQTKAKGFRRLEIEIEYKGLTIVKHLPPHEDEDCNVCGTKKKVTPLEIAIKFLKKWYKYYRF